MTTSTDTRKLPHRYLVAIVLLVSVVTAYIVDAYVPLGHYMFNMFTTLIHEINHSVAALVTGGHVEKFIVMASSGGVAYTAGGVRWIIIPAGYVGCAIFGSYVFYLANRFRWANFFAFFIGIFIVVFTLWHGKPEENGNLTALFIAIGFGGLLIACGYKGPLWLNMWVVNVLATMTALQGVQGAWALFVLSENWHHNDANMMATETHFLTGNIWALLWAAISVLCFAKAFYHGIWKTLRDNENRYYDYTIN